MPSGAKKRKAAKKKKGNQFNNSSSTSTHSHGDDLKHQEIKKDNTIVIEDDSVVKVERGFKIEDESNGGNSSSNGSSSSGDSCSNSSDDESNGIKKSQSIVDNPPAVDSVNPADSLSETPSEAIHVATIKEARVSIKETPVSEEISSLGEESIVDVITPSDNPVASYEVDSVSNENGEKKLSYVVEDKVGISVVSADLGSYTDEGTNIQSVENSVAILGPKECLEPEYDDRLTLSHDAPSATTEHEKDSAVTQPLLAPAQRAVQTTSWKSCCGLFELFNGSGR